MFRKGYGLASWTSFSVYRFGGFWLDYSYILGFVLEGNGALESRPPERQMVVHSVINSEHSRHLGDSLYLYLEQERIFEKQARSLIKNVIIWRRSGVAASGFMNIRIRDNTQEGTAIAGLIISAPAISLWFSSSMWSLLGWRWLKLCADFFVQFPWMVQLVVFAVFPFIGLTLGVWAVWRSRVFLSTSFFILEFMLFCLTAFVFMK